MIPSFQTIGGISLVAKHSKNQTDFMRSSLILGLLLALAVSILIFMHGRRQESLIEKPNDNASQAVVKKRPRVDTLPNIPLQNSTSGVVAGLAKENPDLQSAMQLIDSGNWRDAEAILLDIL